MGKHRNTVNTEEHEPRNTRVKEVRGRAWFLTWNNYTKDNKDCLLKWLNSRKKCKYAIQEECGDSGTIHLQGCFHTGNDVKFSFLQKMFYGCHFERARNINACVQYCTKELSRDGEVYVKGFNIPRKIKDPLEGKDLYGWQKAVLDLIQAEPDDRTVYWFWDPVGCKGKTVLAKHICLNNPGEAIYVSGNYGDIAFAINEHVRIVIWNLPRGNNRAISYKALESVKDGILFSGKYESGMKIFNPPHVIVFANEEPDYSKLSEDRWVVKKIK